MGRCITTEVQVKDHFPYHHRKGRAHHSLTTCPLPFRLTLRMFLHPLRHLSVRLTLRM